MKSILRISFFLALAIIAGCSSNVATSYHTEKWEDFKASSLKESNRNNKVNVVFYREDNHIEGKAINVFVNKQYLTSLLPGAIKQVELCAGKNIFTAYKTDVSERYHTKLSTEIDFNLIQNETLFYKVELSKLEPGKLTFSEIKKSDIPHKDGKVKEQSHTLSRVNTPADCL